VFWVEYVLETEENAKHFLKEQRIDLAELVKKAVSAFEAEAGEMFDESPAGLTELLAEKGKRISATGRSGPYQPCWSSSELVEVAALPLSHDQHSISP
jgi:hypothetical protein